MLSMKWISYLICEWACYETYDWCNVATSVVIGCNIFSD